MEKLGPDEADITGEVLQLTRNQDGTIKMRVGQGPNGKGKFAKKIDVHYVPNGDILAVTQVPTRRGS